MGNLKYVITLTLLLLCLAIGCIEVEEDVTSVTISQADTLRYSLGFFGDEEGVTIEKEPKHARVSELESDVNSGENIYVYFVGPSFTGSDYVELRSGRGSNGESKNRNIIITKLTINVVE